MTQEATDAIGQIRALCQRSIAEGDFTYDHNDELEKLCALLVENPNVDIWAPLLFDLIEEFDDVEEVDLTLGSPGPLVQALESTSPTYEEYLIASMFRKPTGVAVWMADRISRSPGKDENFWLEKIKNVLSHPNATMSAKMSAEE